VGARPTRTGPVVERFPLLRTYEGDLEGRFLATAADVLVESWGDSLRRCPRCGRLFVQVRRQEFCTPKCSQAVRWERYVQAHPERDRDHAAEYESRQTRRLGPRPGSRVKVGPKRPRTIENDAAVERLAHLVPNLVPRPRPEPLGTNPGTNPADEPGGRNGTSRKGRR